LGWIRRLVLAALGSLGLAGIWRFIVIRRQVEAAPDPQKLLIQPPLLVQVARQKPTELAIRWKQQAQTVKIYLGTAADTMDRTTPAATVSGVQAVTLTHLNPHTRYFVELILDDSDCILTAERTLPFSSVVNFRDIGGYPTKDGQLVRWGQVYRSASLKDLSPEDQTHLQAMGIQLICDLRSHDEVQQAPDIVPADVNYLHLPVHTSENPVLQIPRLLFQRDFVSGLLSDVYTRILLDGNPQIFGQIMQHIANQDELPLLIHCAAGKDRTGVAVALLLSLLGVPDDIIIADYTLSNASYAYFYAISQTVFKQLQLFGINEQESIRLLLAEAEVMQTTLNHLRRKYGSVEAYLQSAAQVDASTLEAIKLNLLE